MFGSLQLIWLVVAGLSFISLLGFVAILMRRSMLSTEIEQSLKNKKDVVRAVKAQLDDHYHFHDGEKFPSGEELELAIEKRFKGIVLVDLIEDLFEEVSEEAAQAMRDLLLRAKVDHRLAELSVDQRQQKRMRAVEALKKVGGPIGEIMLQARLFDSESDIRVEAAIGLMELGQLPPLPDLLKQIKVETMGLKSRLYTLFRACAETRGGELLEVLDYTGQESVKVLCLHSLGYLDNADEQTVGKHPKAS